VLVQAQVLPVLLALALTRRPGVLLRSASDGGTR
jgi:hypothetical protein